MIALMSFAEAIPKPRQPALPKRRRLPHEIPPWVDPGSLFFITVCCSPRDVNHLCNPETAEFVLGSARHRHFKGDWFARIVLLMPDHLHALLAFPPGDRMADVIWKWKSYLARLYGIRWQRGFFDHRIRNPGAWDSKALYIRMNPVRAGLITDPRNWPYQWEPR
jgi:REP element-mobilizing transposase RayT